MEDNFQPIHSCMLRWLFGIKPEAHYRLYQNKYASHPQCLWFKLTTHPTSLPHVFHLPMPGIHFFYFPLFIFYFSLSFGLEVIKATIITESGFLRRSPLHANFAINKSPKCLNTIITGFITDLVFLEPLEGGRASPSALSATSSWLESWKSWTAHQSV